MCKLLLFLSVFSVISVVNVLCAETEFEIKQGYRRDRLSWSVSGPEGHPNILSKLTFKHLDVYTTSLRGRASHEGYFVEGVVGYGRILSGTSRDSDYFEDNRHREFSRSRHDVTGDYTFDLWVKGGKNFILDSVWKVSPFVGYSYYVQKVRMRHGVLVQDEEKFPHSKIHGLNTTYKAKWFGPQVGMRIERAVSKQLSLNVEYAFLYPLDFEGRGNWNLRKLTFTQEAKASRSYGQIGHVGAKWTVDRHWSFSCEYELLSFIAKGGDKDRVNPFRKAERHASQVRASIGYEF